MDGVVPRLDFRSGATAASSTLLGREGEFGVLATVLESARSGAGSCVVVEGEAGIGKTALVARARVEAVDSGMGLLDARGSEAETGYAFGVVRQLLEPAVRTASNREREELFAGAAGLAAPCFWMRRRSASRRR